MKAIQKLEPASAENDDKSSAAKGLQLPATGRKEHLNPNAATQKPGDEGKGRAVDSPMPKRQSSEPTPADEPQKRKDKGKSKAIDDPQPKRQKSGPIPAAEPHKSTPHVDPGARGSQDTSMPSARVVQVPNDRNQVAHNTLRFDMLVTQAAAARESGSHHPPIKSPDTAGAPGFSINPSDSSSSISGQRVTSVSAAPLTNAPGPTPEVWQETTLPSGRIVPVSHQRLKVPAKPPALRVSTSRTEPATHLASATSPLRHEVMPGSPDHPETPELVTGSSDPNSSMDAGPITPDNAAPLGSRRASDFKLYEEGSEPLPTNFQFKAGNAHAAGNTADVYDTSNSVAALDRCQAARARSQQTLLSSMDEALEEQLTRIRDLEWEKRLRKNELRAAKARARALNETIRDLKSKGPRSIPGEPDDSDCGSDSDDSDEDKHDPDEHPPGKNPPDEHGSDKGEADDHGADGPESDKHEADDHEADESGADKHQNHEPQPGEHKPDEHKPDEHRPDEHRPDRHESSEHSSNKHEPDEQSAKREKETRVVDSAIDRLPEQNEVRSRPDGQVSEREHGTSETEGAANRTSEQDGRLVRLDTSQLKGVLTATKLEVLPYAERKLDQAIEMQLGSGISVIVPQLNYLKTVIQIVAKMKACPALNPMRKSQKFGSSRKR